MEPSTSFASGKMTFEPSSMTLRCQVLTSEWNRLRMEGESTAVKTSGETCERHPPVAVAVEYCTLTRVSEMFLEAMASIKRRGEQIARDGLISRSLEWESRRKDDRASP